VAASRALIAWSAALNWSLNTKVTNPAESTTYLPTNSAQRPGVEKQSVKPIRI
jgi:hypothetical protein